MDVLCAVRSRLENLLPVDAALGLHVVLGAVLGLLGADLGQELAVRPPDGLDLEQAVDPLERHAARLGHEEEGEEEGQEGQRSEEHVHAVAHGLEHLLGEARHEEVEEPVAGRRGTTGQGAEVGVEEFLKMGY